MGIAFLVNVIKNDVELLFLFRKLLHGISDSHLDAVFYSGALKIAVCFGGFLRIAVSIENFSALAHGTCPPDGGVSDGRAQFENFPRIDEAGVLVKHARYHRAHPSDIP